MKVQKRNNLTVRGNGEQPMLFAHGFGCDQNMWRLVYPFFEDEYKVVLFDHVGAGHSDLSAYNSEKYSSLNGYAQDIIDIIEELRLSDVVFVGHSVSAIIGIIAAINRPELFSKLILVGPSPSYIDDGDYKGGFTNGQIDDLLESMENNHLGWSMAMAPLIMANPDRKELGEELTNSFCRTDPSIAREFARTTFLSDARPLLVDTPVPSLILQCTDDIIAPLTVGEYMHGQMPESTLVVLNATGHCPHLSAPDETVDAIKRYLLHE